MQEDEKAEAIPNCYNQMLVLEKYERVINYLYPIGQSIPRKHGLAREMFIKCLLQLPESIVVAGKSNQISKIFNVDAELAYLRFWLRFLVSIGRMTVHQQQVSQAMISEIGAIVNIWVKNKRSHGRNG
jgi:hypothetical protein